MFLGWISGTSKAFVNRKELAYQSAVDGKAASNHNHDTRYYTKSQIDSMIGGSSGPTVVWSNSISGSTREFDTDIITGIPSSVDYLVFTSTSPVTINQPAVTITKNYTTYIPANYNETSGSIPVTFDGTKLISNRYSFGWHYSGNLVGYSQ